MTLVDPGARVVCTHGLRVRPRSTAFFASSAAPIITDGFEVFVQDVIAAIVTAPWSSSNVVPSAIVTGVFLYGRSDEGALWCGLSASVLRPFAGESDAGNDSADA